MTPVRANSALSSGVGLGVLVVDSNRGSSKATGTLFSTVLSSMVVTLDTESLEYGWCTSAGRRSPCGRVSGLPPVGIAR